MKKILAGIISVLFVLTIVLSFIPTARAAQLGEYGYSLLTNDHQRTAYRKLEEGIGNCAATIEFTSKGISFADIEFALNMVQEDHPEFFWFDGNCSVGMYTSGRTVVQPNGYSVDGKTVDSSNVHIYKQQLENAVTKALKDLPNDSDYEKVLYLHDYIARLVEYQQGEDDQTVYGSLVENKAVCAGYSRALQLLLQRIGIRSWYITGTGYNPTTGRQEPHGWNVVFLNNECYYVDVTWNDRGTDVFHSFFMMSLENISRTHVVQHPEYIPSSCGHNDMDYFVVHAGNGTGIFHGTESAATVADWMKEVAPGEWACEIEALSGDFITWIGKNYTTIASALGLTAPYSYKLSYIENEFHLRITGTPGHKHNSPLRMVSKVGATCTKAGNIEYYVCDSCGDYFYDSAASSKISNKQSVVIGAKGHTYTSGQWYIDSTHHWMKCKDCGLEKPGSKGVHTDKNWDQKCDTCGTRVASTAPSAPVNPPTNPGGTTETNPGATTETNPGCTTETNPGGTTESIPGGTTESIPGGTTETNPGGTMETNPGATTETNPGGSTETNPGGTTESIPGGTTESIPGGTTETNPGGTVETNPGGTTETNPGGTTETNPGSTTVANNGSTETSSAGLSPTKDQGSSTTADDANHIRMQLALGVSAVVIVLLIIVIIVISRRKK